MGKHGSTPSQRYKCVTPSAISHLVAARAALAGGYGPGLAGCKLPCLVKLLALSSAEPLPVRHSGNASGNHGAPLHDQVHLPNSLEPVPVDASTGNTKQKKTGKHEKVPTANRNTNQSTTWQNRRRRKHSGGTNSSSIQSNVDIGACIVYRAQYTTHPYESDRSPSSTTMAVL